MLNPAADHGQRTLLHLVPPVAARPRVSWRLTAELLITAALAVVAWLVTGHPAAAVSYLAGSAVTLALLRPRMVRRTGSR